MIIYQNKQEKVVTIELSKKRMTFAAENFIVRDWVAIYQKTSLVIEKSERAKRSRIFLDDFIA